MIQKITIAIVKDILNPFFFFWNLDYEVLSRYCSYLWLWNGKKPLLNEKDYTQY